MLSVFHQQHGPKSSGFLFIISVIDLTDNKYCLLESFRMALSYWPLITDSTRVGQLQRAAANSSSIEAVAIFIMYFGYMPPPLYH